MARKADAAGMLEDEPPAPKKTPTFTFGGTAEPPKIRRSSIWDGPLAQVEAEMTVEGRWRFWTLGSEAEARGAQQAIKQRLPTTLEDREVYHYRTRVAGEKLYVKRVAGPAAARKPKEG